MAAPHDDHAPVRLSVWKLAIGLLSLAALAGSDPASAREDDDVNTEDIVKRLGDVASKYNATVCNMTEGEDTDLYILLEEKSPGAVTEEGYYPVSVWRLDRDGSDGYLGCDGGIDANGHFGIGQATSGYWMAPYCICALHRMHASFASEPLEKTSGKALVRRAEQQSCGTIDPELYRLVRQCSEEGLPPLE